MPIPREDPHSGAIIFDLTASEQQVQTLTEAVAEMSSTISDLKAQIEEMKNSSTT